ncbi:MAG TPA: LytTR family DNA-binding domain-containing protein [Bacteroidales bacterium]|nr:LytTR family DNA-binding domain-containing protein [Bacteroidales bacterium]
MFDTLLIDDEQDTIDFLSGAIAKYCPDARIVGYAMNIEDGLSEIFIKKPNIVFLDINLPGGNGFELLNRIPDRQFEVIFVTAYNEHAIRAFRYSAIDYILKPVDISELIDAINKATRSFVRTEVNMIHVLMENLTAGYKKLSIPTLKGYEYILIDDIIRMEADRSYCNFYLTQKRKFTVSKCLNDYQLLLENSTFFRVHNSHLINLKLIKSYLKNDGGYVEMVDGSIIPISRTKKDFFLKAIKQHIIK